MTKISHIDRLPFFLTQDAPRAAAPPELRYYALNVRASDAKNREQEGCAMQLTVASARRHSHAESSLREDVWELTYLQIL